MANLDLYNNPFNNYVQRNYVQQTPQNRLQTAYNQAMQKKTPEWARTVSDIMPSLAEIGAYFGTKGAFNRGTIANSLEREKDRRTAYNQMMRENEERQANDYVQMAKEQLGIDLAQDDREYNRNMAQLGRDERLNAQKQAYEQWLQDQENKKRELDIKQQIADTQRIVANSKPESKPEMTPEEKLAWDIKAEEAKAKAKAKREASQDLNKALAGQQAFENNIKHLEDLSKKSGTVFDRLKGSYVSLFTGKDVPAVAPNNSMDELVSQLRQAALVASGISGESDDKAQQAKLKDIYERAGVPMNAKSLTQAQVSSIINNIRNIYNQRVAEKQGLLDSFKENQDNNFSVSWGK